MKQRNDDFKERRVHLDAYNDQELKAYFFELTDQLVDPLLELAFAYTTPAIERSVLMRMGFSSIEAKTITDRLFELELLAHGAGHVVYLYAQKKKLSIREAGLLLLEDHDLLKEMEVLKK
jgi:D-ornithine 4,5-aminomutase subunit alpha